MSLNIPKEEKRIFHNKTIRLPEEVIAQVDKIASDKNISFNKVILQLVEYALKDVEEQAGKKFGDSSNPLLVSVRSGARVSMPGMMETILNLGLNDETVEAMIKLTNNPRFCYDSYRRFLTMFGSVAWEMDRQKYFESEVEKVKEREGVKEDTQISAEGWKSLIPVYKQTIKEVTGKEFPQDDAFRFQARQTKPVRTVRRRGRYL